MSNARVVEEGADLLLYPGLIPDSQRWVGLSSKMSQQVALQTVEKIGLKILLYLYSEVVTAKRGLRVTIS